MLPRTVDSEPAQLADEEGVVVPGFEEGVVFLRDGERRTWRVTWESEADGKERRALPAGRYSLIGYRLVRKDADGTMWHLSATQPKGIRDVEVRAAEATKIELDPTIHLNRSIVDGARVAVQIFGEKHAGLSIYADGKRIPLRYRVTDEGGKEVASGAVEYG